MKEIKTKLQTLGFNSGHIQLLTVAFIVLGSLIVVKSGINVTTMFAKADSQKTLTYEQAQAEVLAASGTPDQSAIAQANADDQAQISLIDPGNIDGQVLGEAIGVGAIPDADQLVIPDITTQVSITQISQDTDATKLAYQNSVQQIENDADITTLLSELNSSDKPTLEHAVKGWEWVIDTLEQTPVPQSLAEYHKDKIIYYTVLQHIGKIYAGQSSESDLQMLTKAMLSYSQKVETLRTGLNEQFKLNL